MSTFSHCTKKELFQTCLLLSLFNSISINRLCIFVGFYFLVVMISDYLHHHPLIMMLFPFTFVFLIAAVMPLVVFVSFIVSFVWSD